jgi:hypothetical protein
MDQMKDMAGDAMSSGNLQDTLKSIKYPASKDEVINQLQQKGAPSQIVDKLRSVDMSKFNTPQEVISQVQGMV